MITDRIKLLGALAAFAIAATLLLAQTVKLRAADKAIASERAAHAVTQKALGTCRGNVANLDAALSAQNEAVRALELAGAERARRAAEAIQHAKAEAGRYRKAALDIARAQPGPDRCESAANLMRATLEAER